MSDFNTQVLMKRHPKGMVAQDDFDLVERPLPRLKDGEALVRNHFLSLDPYMRPRMDPVRSYVEPLNPGDLMPGATVGEVVDSRSDGLPNGTMVTGMLGWQAYGVVTKRDVRRLSSGMARPSMALGVLGMTGVTAHYGMLELGRPQEGDTVVVTAAAGAVGSVAGQIAKIAGSRVVGIAGGSRKCRYVVDELGFDVCVDYRASDFVDRLRDATEDHVDVLFENVGGPVLDAVLQRINDHARVALCGNISDYNATEPYPFRGMRQLLMHRVTLSPFIIADHDPHWRTALQDLSQWTESGRIRFKEDVSEGLHSAPAAFIRMLTGANFGKQLVAL